MKGDTPIYSVNLIEIILKHYPESGVFATYYIPADPLLIRKGIESIIESETYKICKILYLYANESMGDNNKYLDLMDWDYINSSVAN